MEASNEIRAATPWRRMLSSAGVLGFYCILSVFDDPDRTRGVGDHVAFLFTLVGIA